MKNKNLFISLGLLIFGFVAIWQLSDNIERKRPHLPPQYEDAELTFKSETLAKFSLGLNGLFADYYWISSLQYIGKKIVGVKGDLQMDNLTGLNPRQLYPLLDSATNLDPKFVNVYSFGAIILPAIDEEKAIKLAEKGIVNNPEAWRLYQHLGYIYWKKGDFKKAADTYQKGSTIEGVPAFMKIMAARMESEGGSRDVARQIYQQMYDEAADDTTKGIAAGRLLQVESFEERDVINKILKDFESKNQRCVNDWREVFQILKFVKLAPNNRTFLFDSTAAPIDPSNTAYLLDKTKCEATLDDKLTKILIK
jgi:tetratricopeptide (TPR) repeat protein